MLQDELITGSSSKTSGSESADPNTDGKKKAKKRETECAYSVCILITFITTHLAAAVGTLTGVFIPTVCTILGVVIFMRLVRSNIADTKRDVYSSR